MKRLKSKIKNILDDVGIQCYENIIKKINKKDNLDKKYLINDGRSFLTVEKHKGKWFLKKNQLW